MSLGRICIWYHPSVVFVIAGVHPRRVPFEADVQFPAMAAQILQATRSQTLLRQASQGKCSRESVIMQPARRARRPGCIPFRPERKSLFLRLVFEKGRSLWRQKSGTLSHSQRETIKRPAAPPQNLFDFTYQQRRRQNKSLSVWCHPFCSKMRSERRLNSSFLPGLRVALICI